MRRVYGLYAENRDPLHLDPERIPGALRHLLALAEQFGESDDLIREDIIAKTSPAKLAELCLAVRACENALEDWLAGPEASGPEYSSEYIAYTCLLMIADESSATAGCADTVQDDRIAPVVVGTVS